jgi:hypothetical protein
VELFFLKVLRTLKPEATPRPAHIVPADHQTSVQVEKNVNNWCRDPQNFNLHDFYSPSKRQWRF